MIRYAYAVTTEHGAPLVYRFPWPSDRDLWCAYASQHRRSVLSGHPLVVDAKDQHEATRAPWPSVDWSGT